MLSPITGHQFEFLRERFPDATLDELPGQVGLVTIPMVTLPPGWSANKTAIWFLVPAGYPGPCPDCFWADNSLKLANGQPPQNSQINQIPGTAISALWFSWHLTTPQGWNPARDDLRAYFGVILDRFRHPQ
jgi:hypothetical protein